jgi:hypothetical protein
MATTTESKQVAVAPPVSASDTVSSAQTAKNNGATLQSPADSKKILKPDGRIVNAQSAVTSSNAISGAQMSANVDTGTNSKVKTTAQTQAIGQPNSPALVPVPQPEKDNTTEQRQAGIANINNIPKNSGIQSGAAAPGDDQREKQQTEQEKKTNAVKNKINELYGGKVNAIISQDNVLDKYSSYTYSLSWYLMSPKAYNRLVKDASKNIDGMYLLAQSGGANLTSTTTNTLTSTVTQGPGRNKFFNLDYYIDNVEFEVQYAGKSETSGPAIASNLVFTVTEPNGITLIADDTQNTIFFQ